MSFDNKKKKNYKTLWYDSQYFQATNIKRQYLINIDQYTFKRSKNEKYV